MHGLNLLFYHPHDQIWSCLETYILRFLPFCDSFYGYFTYYFTFPEENVADSYHDNPLFFVHLSNNIAWLIQNVKRFIEQVDNNKLIHIVTLQSHPSIAIFLTIHVPFQVNLQNSYHLPQLIMVEPHYLLVKLFLLYFQKKHMYRETTEISLPHVL